MKPMLQLVVGVMLSAAVAGAQEDPDYPLGKLGVPPITKSAEPLRLMDLRFGFERNGASVSSFDTRLKLGSHGFLGGEVRDERLGVFFDTQRLELGMSEEDGAVDLEGAYRARFFRVGVDAAKRRDDTWNLIGDGSIRLSHDWEILLGYHYDTDGSRGGPPSLEEFIETGRLPRAGRATRVLRSGSVGFLYQKDTQLELSGDTSVARIRTEAGFDQTRTRSGGAAVWNISHLELDGRASFDRVSGRVERTEGRAELGATLRIAGHFLATARTLQEWQPGVERFVRDHRVGGTFFGRRFRFARSSDIADAVLRLTRRANELGYNERRVYDLDSLRALRDRLSLSPARAELAELLEALYLAQVRERNVPQLGFELARTTDELTGSEATAYAISAGVPWRIAWPFTRGERRTEFIRFDWLWRKVRFPSLGWQTRSHELTATAELSRQHVLRFRWESPGQTPEELALRIRRGRRWSAEYVFALGR